MTESNDSFHEVLIRIQVETKYTLLSRNTSHSQVWIPKDEFDLIENLEDYINKEVSKCIKPGKFVVKSIEIVDEYDMVPF
jgi:hypothetical protein